MSSAASELFVNSARRRLPTGHHGCVTTSSVRLRPQNVWEVFRVFLQLGVTSFGGPVAHLGYFHEEFVERRRWLNDREYADLVALCQFLPGPASSQVGMAIGLQRAGLWGLFAAWTAFTLPSAIVLVGFAFGVASFGDLSDAGWISGLKAAAVAVVAHAVFGMARTLTPDAKRATIALLSLIAVLLIPHVAVQVVAIVAAGLIGLVWLRTEAPDASEPMKHFSVPRPVAIGSLAIFGALLIALLLVVAATGNSVAQLFDSFYRAGALVFGGGHVVLPLLEAEVVGTGMVSADAFLAGYGAAQAVPGPLFTFAAYLGAMNELGPTGLVGAAIALIAVFLPAALLVIGVLPFWERVRHFSHARRALMGVNAGVVGILAAALYSPVFTLGITSPLTLAIAAAAFVALRMWKAPAWAVVIAAAVLGWLLL